VLSGFHWSSSGFIKTSESGNPPPIDLDRMTISGLIPASSKLEEGSPSAVSYLYVVDHEEYIEITADLLHILEPLKAGHVDAPSACTVSRITAAGRSTRCSSPRGTSQVERRIGAVSEIAVVGHEGDVRPVDECLIR
jgi:hypothetical protein